MSETKRIITIPKEVVKKLSFISVNFKNLNTGNKTRNFWMITQENAESYEWDSFDIGVNDSNELIVVKQFGCSCNSWEFPEEADNKYPLKDKIIIPWESYYTEEFEEYSEFLTLIDTLYDLFKEKSYKVEKVLAIPNAEIRRAVIEYIGLDEFMEKVKPKVLDTSTFGKLMKIEIKNDRYGSDEDIVAVQVQDSSTDRKYFLRVPPKIKTAREAVAWTFGLNEDEYNPIAES